MLQIYLPCSSWRQRWVGHFRAIATYDVFPEFSARVRRLFYNPLGILGLAAIVALLCGAFLHAQGFVLAGSVLAVMVLGILWPWLSLWGLKGSLKFAKARGVEGEPIGLSLTLSNRLPWSAYGLSVRGGLDEGIEPSVGIASTPGRRTVLIRWSCTPLRRGVYPRETPRVATGFPFGLWENRRALAIEAPLLVWPRTYPVGPVPPLMGDQQVEGNVSRHKVGTSGDVLGVRPYRRGDSPRRIHWGQSARHDRLIVCELQANARPVVQLVLDTDPASHVGRGPDSSREWAIRIAASLARGWLVAGVEVGGVWQRQVIPPAAGPRQISALLDSLARLPDAEGPPLQATLALPACRGFSSGLQIVVSTDLGASRTPRGSLQTDYRRWVILQTSGFLNADGSGSLPKPRLPFHPWLLVSRPEQVPGLLRGGWREARHGS